MLPLAVAATCGNRKIVEDLLRHDADPNIPQYLRRSIDVSIFDSIYMLGKKKQKKKSRLKNAHRKTARRRYESSASPTHTTASTLNTGRRLDTMLTIARTRAHVQCYDNII